MTGPVEGAFVAFTADPDYVWGYVIVVGKNYSRRGKYYAQAGPLVPLVKKRAKAATCILMFSFWLSGHVEFSIDDFIAIEAVRHLLQIGRSKSVRNYGSVS